MSITELQSIPVECINQYTGGDYLFIAVTREQLEGMLEGHLKVNGEYLQAIVNPIEWVKLEANRIRESGSMFLAIFQKKDIIDAGFEEVEIVPKDPKGLKQKIDDGFEEYRAYSDVRIKPIGYCALGSSRKSLGVEESFLWREFYLKS